jgi:hypothetical protein
MSADLPVHISHAKPGSAALFKNLGWQADPILHGAKVVSADLPTYINHVKLGSAALFKYLGARAGPSFT